MPSKTKLPSGLVFAVWEPSGPRISTVTPGSPSSSRSTTPGLPPPGLKSRHTTPAMPPATRSGRTACSASSGTSLERIPVRPSSAVPPGLTGSRSVIDWPSPCTTGFEGWAPVRGPGGLTSSYTAAMAAFTAPWSGLISSITRQITPAAKNEIAMGVNTASLNAADQLMRSVSTAKMRPIAVTSAGTTPTQMAVFLTEVRRASSEKNVW